jgi:uncharacterized protein
MLVMLRDADTDGAPSVQAYFTRCFALVLLGVANFALFLWPGEILTNYGLAGLVLFLFRKSDLRVLVTASAALLAMMTIYLAVPGFERAQTLRDGAVAAQLKADGKTLTEEQQAALDGRQKTLDYVHPKPEKVKAEIAKRTSFPGVLVWSAEKWTEYNLSGLSLAFLAESVAVMLLGLFLFRTGVLGGEKSLGLYALMAVGGYGAGLAIRGALLAWQWAHLFEPTPEGQIAGGFTYELSRLPITVGLTGLVLFLYKAGAINWLKGALGAIGRLALTNYIGQSIITSILFYGFGMLNRIEFAGLMGVSALVWVFQAIFSLLWLRRWQMGPAEWLLRSLTYGRWRPLERTA